MRKVSGQKGYIGAKLDMAKIYDRVEWVFLKHVMISMGSLNKRISLIMKCVTTVSFSVALVTLSDQVEASVKGSPLPLPIHFTCASPI